MVEDLSDMQAHSYILATHTQQATQLQPLGMAVAVEPAAMAVLVPEQSEAPAGLERPEVLVAHHILEVWSAMSFPD